MSKENVVCMADARGGERFAVHLFGGSALSELESELELFPFELDLGSAIVRGYRLPYEQMAEILDRQLNDAGFQPCSLGDPEIRENYCHYFAEFWPSGKEKVTSHLTKILDYFSPRSD